MLKAHGCRMILFLFEEAGQFHFHAVEECREDPFAGGSIGNGFVRRAHQEKRAVQVSLDLGPADPLRAVLQAGRDILPCVMVELAARRK